MKLTKAKLLEMYEMMVRIRTFEENVKELFKAGLFPGWTHVCIGEEAGVVGACFALRKDDYMASTHRGHGQCIAKGMSLKGMMAELMGKVDGVCKGKGGSMHLGDISVGAMGGNAILGAGAPIASGAALSAKTRGTDQVALAFFGDGASNQGAVHEAMNIAALWKLPVIFVCENNQYGISVSQAKHTPIKDIATRAAAYDMPGFVVDGNDVVEVYQAAEKAVKRARAGEGPTLLECKTYRWRGHHEGDPNQGARYRTKDEIAVWKKKCPIAKLEKHLLKNKIATSKKMAAISADIDKAIDDAVAFAAKSDFPKLEEMYEDVYTLEEEIR